MADNNDNDEKENDKEMTPEQRLEWLRDHGIEVTTPEERRAAQVAQALHEADAVQEEEEISYVLVPADKTSPLKELSFRPATSGAATVAAGDQLMEHLKPAFRGGGSQVDLSLLQQSPGAQTLLGAATGDGDTATVSDATLKAVADEANVETFVLVHALPANQYTSVQIYLDEIGMLKRLPLNARATDYAKAAGFDPPPQFYGDVFIGRIKKKPVLKNESFVLGPDTSMDSAVVVKIRGN